MPFIKAPLWTYCPQCHELRSPAHPCACRRWPPPASAWREQVLILALSFACGCGAWALGMWWLGADWGVLR